MGTRLADKIRRTLSPEELSQIDVVIPIPGKRVWSVSYLIQLCARAHKLCLGSLKRLEEPC